MYSAEKPDDIDRFFRGLTEHAFHARLGVVDPPLVDYVATLLIRSLRSDQLPVWPGAVKVDAAPEFVAGDELDDTDLLALVDHDPSAGEGFRRLGDSALFWTGVYPEALNRPGTLPGLPIPAGAAVVAYRLVGKRAYRIASALVDAAAPVDRGVLGRLADEFDLCAEGLSEVRRAWSEAA
jgi:hypothetical protein